MDLNELNEWIETEEGKHWLDEHKAPLLKKRDELLEQNRALRDQVATSTQRVNDAEQLLETERNSLRTTLVNQEIESFLDRFGSPVARDAARIVLNSRLSDIELSTDGEQRKPLVSTEHAPDLRREDGEELPEKLELSDFLHRWARSPEGAQFTVFGNSGGGAGGNAPAPASDDEGSAFRAQLLEKIRN